MSERITGYILLIAGILTMIFSFFQIIQVLTGNAKPLRIFSQNTINTEKVLPDTSTFLDQLQLGTSELKLPEMQIIDPEVVNSFLNMLFYYLIMQFLLSFGYKIATLGTQMLRPIHVTMKNRELVPENVSQQTTI